MGKSARNIIAVLLSLFLPLSNMPTWMAENTVFANPSNLGSLTPSLEWGIFFDTTGDIVVTVAESGIAVRVEVPREFIAVNAENVTSFVESDITHDYWFYSVYDEAQHYSYRRDGPCFKTNFSRYDPNAPWCIEIWNMFNNTFRTFQPPKVVKFKTLSAPRKDEIIAGTFNINVTVAKTTIPVPGIGPVPDFLGGVFRRFEIPVSMREDPTQITGFIFDEKLPPPNPPIRAKGIVYATEINTGFRARGFVNVTTGSYNITGLYAGTYRLEASAGFYQTSGFAYSLTAYAGNPVFVGKGSSFSVSILLKRAPQIKGTVEYLNATTRQPMRSITDHGWLTKTLPSAKRVLNITVEATDLQGFAFRDIRQTSDTTKDEFRIVLGTGTRFVGYPSYGTEFAGLPQGPRDFTLKAWIYGYIQRDQLNVKVQAGDEVVVQVQIFLLTGGVITANLRLLNPLTEQLETPRQAETTIFAIQPPTTPTDRVFGGNILVQAFDSAGTLRGVVVLNRTTADGRVTYAGENQLTVHILGFSEFLNQTYSGVWKRLDYGLGTAESLGGEIFTIKVSIRGYWQKNIPTVFLPLGGNSTRIVDLYRGGMILVDVNSMNVRFGTKIPQAFRPFETFGSPVPPFLRVYFYDSRGVEVGWVERRLDPTVSTLRNLAFSGHDWQTRKIIYFGNTPSALPADLYDVRGFAHGYIQERRLTVAVTPGLVSRAVVTLLIANSINVIAVLRQDENLFTALEFDVFARANVFDLTGNLRGVQVATVAAGNQSLRWVAPKLPGFPVIAGFTGVDHFFYVSPDGVRNFDYGLDAGNYTVRVDVVRVPELGDGQAFMQTSTIRVFLPFLGTEEGTTFDMFRLGILFQGSQPVTGFDFFSRPVKLSWVTVNAGLKSTGTFDGLYTLRLPKGVYTVTFTIRGFVSQTFVNVPVGWSSVTPLSPPPLSQSGSSFPAIPPVQKQVLAGVELTNGVTRISLYSLFRQDSERWLAFKG